METLTMKYGNFEYRVVFDKKDGHFILQLFEYEGVYYFISKQPSIPLGFNYHQLKSSFDQHLEAFKKPTLPIESIKSIQELPITNPSR